MTSHDPPELPAGHDCVEFTREERTFLGSYRVVGVGATAMVYLTSPYAHVDPRRVVANDPKFTALMMLREKPRLASRLSNCP